MDLRDFFLKSGENAVNFVVMLVAQLFNILKSIEWYILNEWILWYVNYISIKLLLILKLLFKHLQ